MDKKGGATAILLALVITLGACVPPHGHEELARRVDRIEREQERSREGLRLLQEELKKQGAEERKARWWGVIRDILTILVRRGR